MTVVLHRADVAAINSQFEVVADDAADRVQQRIVQQVSFLKAAHSFFISQGSFVDREAFASFVAGLDLPKRYEGIGGIGYSEYIVTGDEAFIEAEIDTEYGEPALVWPETTDQGRRAPIVIIEPIDFLREGALGFDSFSDSVRREAIIGAIATGRAHASGVVSLVQSAGGKERGVIVYFPVREEVEGPELGPIKGFVFGGFYVDSLHEATLRRDPKLPVVVRTEDITNGGASLVYESPNFEEIAKTSPFELTRRIVIAGRDWEMTIRGTPEFGNTRPSIGIYALGAVSVLLALALAASAHAQLRALEAARRLHESSEKSMQDKDMMLQEMKHRIKNSIARVLAIARQTASHADSLEDFSNSFMARMQAMARAQDMLTRSHWQRADLHELLTTELNQVFGEEASENYIMPGEVVELSERATQALGLVFHELATNALKYGGVSDEDGKLSIGWTIDRTGDDDLLIIDWREHAPTPVAASDHTGFGTRLIEANIRGELSGTVERSLTETGMHMRLSIPTAGYA